MPSYAAANRCIGYWAKFLAIGYPVGDMLSHALFQSLMCSANICLAALARKFAFTGGVYYYYYY